MTKDNEFLSLSYIFNPSPRRHFLMPMQQTTIENIFAKGEIALHKQFHLLPQCFQLYLLIILAFIEIFHILILLFSKLSATN